MSTLSHSRMTVTEVGEFLRDPPAGFSVETLGSDYRVHSDDETNLVLIDDFQSCSGKITFQNSLGRKVKMRNLCEYTRVRQNLLSKRIYLLVNSCDQNSSVTRTKPKDLKIGLQYMLSIDSRDPFLRWQMERGLDWTISSVAGESYCVDVLESSTEAPGSTLRCLGSPDHSESLQIDIVESLETWRAEQPPDDAMRTKPVWRDASFTLKYESDALFDFPHWFGFSKRTFKLRVT